MALRKMWVYRTERTFLSNLLPSYSEVFKKANEVCDSISRVEKHLPQNRLEFTVSAGCKILKMLLEIETVTVYFSKIVRANP